MKLLWSNLSLGGLYTDTNTDADADDTDDDDNDNDTRRTEHDCIGSLPNEPKKQGVPLFEKVPKFEKIRFNNRRCHRETRHKIQCAGNSANWNITIQLHISIP